LPVVQIGQLQAKKCQPKCKLPGFVAINCLKIYRLGKQAGEGG